MRVSSVVIGVTVVAALFLGWRLFSATEPTGADATAMAAQAPEPLPNAAAIERGTVLLAQDERLRQIAEALRSKYGDRIHQADWQIKVITHLMSLLQELYPENWRDAMAAVLRLAFPEWAEALLARLDDWLDYQRWLRDVFGVMTFTSAEQRYQTLWDKRLALFGEDARVIWAAEQQQRAFNDAVEALDQQPGSVGDKAQRYVELVRDTWGEKAFGNHGRHTTQLMGDFVMLESVQSQLRDMSPEQQDAVLTEFRRNMGLDDSAIERWSELDEERREHRTLGSIYMENRAAIVEELDGEAEQQAIEQLQLDMFGEEEARYIRNEEASGVFRFEQEQIIGLN